MQNIISKKEAISKGLKFYNTGKSCKFGHYSDRATKTGVCEVCKKEFYSKNKDKINEDYKEYYLKKKKIISEKRKQFYQENTVKISKKKKEYYLANRQLIIEKTKRFNEENKEKISQQKKEFYLINKDKIKKFYLENKKAINEKRKTQRRLPKNRDKTHEANQKYYLDNKDQVLKSAKYYRETRGKIIRKRRYQLNKNNPNFRMRHNLKNRLYQALKEKGASKDTSTIKLLGIKIEYFKKYLEHKFKPGMTWENYGSIWHLDHIIPISIVDISIKENLNFVCNYRNLQPLFAEDNRKKSNKIFIEWEKHMKIRDIDYLIKNILKRCHPEQEFDIRLINQKNKKGVELIFKHTIN